MRGWIHITFNYKVKLLPVQLRCFFYCSGVMNFSDVRSFSSVLFLVDVGSRVPEREYHNSSSKLGHWMEVYRAWHWKSWSCKLHTLCSDLTIYAWGTNWWRSVSCRSRRHHRKLCTIGLSQQIPHFIGHLWAARRLYGKEKDGWIRCFPSGLSCSRNQCCSSEKILF